MFALTHVDALQPVLVGPGVFLARQALQTVSLTYNLLQFLHAEDSILESLLEVKTRHSRLNVKTRYIDNPAHGIDLMVVVINRAVLVELAL